MHEKILPTSKETVLKSLIYLTSDKLKGSFVHIRGDMSDVINQMWPAVAMDITHF